MNSRPRRTWTCRSVRQAPWLLFWIARVPDWGAFPHTPTFDFARRWVTKGNRKLRYDGFGDPLWKKTPEVAHLLTG